MPGKIKVKVLAGRNLPVMDRAADTTDAFVEIKFGGVTHKTDVCRKSLNPHWNSTEWYRFEVDDSELQDEPLQLRLMDHDTYSANDAIGKVVVSLAPLLAREPLQTSQRPAHTGAIMSGWIPVFDTMHGIRGELNIIVKVELFSDFNKFRQSSCGVHFFHCPSIPPGYRASAIHGFVEELIVNDDPEYQWIDKIRTPRASNEARQVAFIKLSNQVQRLVGLKAAELGANAVVGYRHAFDLEGESGVVARATGTAVTIVALPTPCQPLSVPQQCTQQEKGGSPRGVHTRAESYGGKELYTPTPLSSTVNGTHPPISTSLNATSAPVGMHRRSSDSDLSITPKGSSLTMSGAGNTSATGGAILRPSMNSNNLEMLEYPFLTMTEYPPNFIVHIGGMVCARSVKLMDGAEGASRAAWWAELRTELRAHARALRCTAVLGYAESATICEDVCILSASGTAAVIDLETDFTGDAELNTSMGATQTGSAGDTELPSMLDEEGEVPANCALAHVPYSASGMPYRAELSMCALCRRARVPAVLLSTLERPRGLPAAGRSCLVTAAAARARRTAPTAEPAARDLSDQLPFLEYELHRLLLAKLYMQGANALFGLRTQIAVGERAVVALATGTGALVTALPSPHTPKLKPSEGIDIRETGELQRALHEALAANRARNGFEPMSPDHREPPPDLAEEPPALELCGDKGACVLELDESEDVETARALAVQRPRHLVAATTARLCGVRAAPASRPHAFAQVWRARLTLSGGGGGGGAAERHVARALDGIHYKLRRLAPAALADLSFQLDLPEDEMQLLVSGVALPLVDPTKPETNGLTRSVTGSASNCAVAAGGSADYGAETIFSLDEEQATPPRQGSVEKQSGDEKSLSPPIEQTSGCAWSGIVVTPLSVVSGARCQRWLCALQLLFVRETSSVRELGGLSGLLHTFITEVLAIVRAYTAALGGNALASFYITELMLQENPHKNQGQCLLSVGGDVIHVTY